MNTSIKTNNISLRDVLANTPRMGRTKKTQDKWIARLKEEGIRSIKDLESKQGELGFIGCGLAQLSRFIETARRMGVNLPLSAYETKYKHTNYTYNPAHIRRMLRQSEEQLAFWKSEAARLGIKEEEVK